MQFICLNRRHFRPHRRARRHGPAKMDPTAPSSAIAPTGAEALSKRAMRDPDAPEPVDRPPPPSMTSTRSSTADARPEDPISRDQATDRRAQHPGQNDALPPDYAPVHTTSPSASARGDVERRPPSTPTASIRGNWSYRSSVSAAWSARQDPRPRSSPQPSVRGRRQRPQPVPRGAGWMRKRDTCATLFDPPPFPDVDFRQCWTKKTQMQKPRRRAASRRKRRTRVEEAPRSPREEAQFPAKMAAKGRTASPAVSRAPTANRRQPSRRGSSWDTRAGEGRRG